MNQILRLVRTFAADGVGRQIRSVGLNQQSFGGDMSSHGSQVVCVLIGDHAGKADVQSQVQESLCVIKIAAVRVHDASQRLVLLPAPQTSEDLLGTRSTPVGFFGFPQMNHEWQSCRPGKPDVTLEHGFLQFARCQVPVVIQSGLADRHDFRMCRQFYNLLPVAVAGLRNVIGLNSDGGVDVGKLLGQGHTSLACLGGGADGNQRLHASGFRPFDQRGLIILELFVVQMKMGINILRQAVHGPIVVSDTSWRQGRE